MNHCRICWKTIPNIFNWWLALRCSECRAIQDEKLSEMMFEHDSLESENEYLRSRFFDTEREYAERNYKYSKLKKRYDLLRQRHSVVIRENARLTKKNEEMNRVFMQKCEEMRKEIFDLNKKVEEQYHTIQQYEQWFAIWSYHWEE